jgi:separase
VLVPQPRAVVYLCDDFLMYDARFVIFQVAMMHELIGNGTEAEVLLRTGKEISNFHGLSVFRIAFTSLLGIYNSFVVFLFICPFGFTFLGICSGQLYSKRQLWDEADSELKNAQDLLLEHDAIVSCKLCKLTLEVSVDMKVGDLFWSRFENDFQKLSTVNLPMALGMYRSALEKLNSTDMEFLTGSFDSLKTACHVCSRDCIISTEHGVCNGKEPVVSKDGMLLPCTVCVLLRQASVDHCNKPTTSKARMKITRNAEAGPPLDVKTKRTSRNSSRLAKEQNAETNAKTRTRSSKRTVHVKGDGLPSDALVCGESECFPGGIDLRKDGLCNMFGCWKCLLVKSLNSGCIQNILQFRWDCVRRRYRVSLLLKIGISFYVSVFCCFKIETCNHGLDISYKE